MPSDSTPPLSASGQDEHAVPEDESDAAEWRREYRQFVHGRVAQTQAQAQSWLGVMSTLLGLFSAVVVIGHAPQSTSCPSAQAGEDWYSYLQWSPTGSPSEQWSTALRRRGAVWGLALLQRRVRRRPRSDQLRRARKIRGSGAGGARRRLPSSCRATRGRNTRIASSSWRISCAGVCTVHVCSVSRRCCWPAF